MTNGPDNFQRIGAISNAHAGSEFEGFVRQFFAAQGIPLEPNFKVEVGVSQLKKSHRFDLGSEAPAIVVECKSHNWTTGGNVPSAKITVWNEAMYYFYVAPAHFRKVLFTLKSTRGTQTLAAYYIRNFSHLIPQDVEIWEYDVIAHAAQRLK